MSDEVNEDPNLENSKQEDLTQYFSGKGNPHPIREEMENLRKLLLSSGFDEIQISHFLPFDEAKKLTGNLYPLFRNSIFHLSWIRMDPIPPDPEIDSLIASRFPDLDRAELWNLLDTLDDDTSGESILHKIMEELGLDMDGTIDLMTLIPGFTKGTPATSDITLRSFIPTSWLTTVEATCNEEALPIRLFTTAVAYRREPIPDPRHNQVYHVLSMAVVDKDLTMDKCRRIAGRLFDSIGLDDVTMVEKSYPFPYFEKGTELEIFGGDLELGTCGFISREILDKRGLDTDVFILDLGIERILMHKHGYPDIRTLFFPQFYKAWDLSDQEISDSIKYKRYPLTDMGKSISKAIYDSYRKAYGDDNAETGRLTAWKGVLAKIDGALTLAEGTVEGEIIGNAEIYLKEAKTGLGLIGPAAMNDIYVLNGDILGLPSIEEKRMLEAGAVKTGINYVNAFSNLAAWKIEKSLERGHTGKSVENVRGLEEINLKVDSKALYYTLSHGKKVDVKGPVYLRFYFKVKDA